MSEFKRQIGAGATVAVVVAFVLALSVGTLFPQASTSESMTSTTVPGSTSSSTSPSSTSSSSPQGSATSSSSTVSSVPTTVTSTTTAQSTSSTVTVSTTSTGSVTTTITTSTFPTTSTTTTMQSSTSATTISSTSTFPSGTVIIPQGATYQVQSSYDCLAGHVATPFNVTTASFLEGGISAGEPGVTIYVSTVQQAQTTNQGHPAAWIYSTALTNSTTFAVLLAPGFYLLWTEGADLNCGAGTVMPLEALTTVTVTQAVMLAGTATVTVTTTATRTVTVTTTSS